MATKTATYKGKTYRLEFLGQTKFGRKAKLAFLDGSKEFWVDAALVTECDSSSATRTAKSSRSQYPRTGCSCGSRDGIIQDSDCWTCKHDAE
jgi:hypothetical protein